MTKNKFTEIWTAKDNFDSDGKPYTDVIRLYDAEPQVAPNCWFRLYTSTEVDALIAEKDRQLEIAREALEGYCECGNDEDESFFICPACKAQEALRKLDGERKE